MILQDEKRLRFPSDPVSSYEEGVEIANKLLEEVALIGGSERALGLAAPQIGIFKRVFIAWGSSGKSGLDEQWNIYINPTLEEVVGDERMFFVEGCLSFPYSTVKTHRPKQIIVSTLEDDGERRRYVILERDAIVFQHEIDHLDGVLMFDRVATSVEGSKKIGRNDPCPCGSGKKYKKCCGR